MKNSDVTVSFMLYWTLALGIVAASSAASTEDLEQYRITVPSGRETYLLGDILVDRSMFGTEAWGAGPSWPNSTVYYVFDSSVSPQNRGFFAAVVDEWSQKSGLQFVEVAGQYHLVISDNQSMSACGSSYVGMVFGAQDLMIRCWTSSTILHEVGHAIGMPHEQQRLDRNFFVTVADPDNLEGACPSIYGPNYAGVAGTAFSAYDFDSIMHYGSVNSYFCSGAQRTITMTATVAQPSGEPAGSETACTSPSECTNLMGSGFSLSLRDGYGAAQRYGYRLVIEGFGLAPDSVDVSGDAGTCSGSNCYIVMPGATIGISAPSVANGIAFVGGACLGRGSCTFEVARNEVALVRKVPWLAIARGSSLLWSLALFTDGFESSDTGAWSLAVP